MKWAEINCGLTAGTLEESHSDQRFGSHTGSVWTTKALKNSR